MTFLQAYLKNPKTQKVLSKKLGEEGFSLIELVVVVAVLAVLSAIAIPSFMSIADKARSAAAANTVAQVAKECAVKITNDPDTVQTYSAVKLDGYDTFTVNTSTTNCSDSGLIVATSSDPGKYPTFTYDISSGDKTCSATTVASQNLGCKNGTW